LEIDLKTGRSHQIRVQLAHIGHAITGDAKYGGRKHKDSKRIRLWSYYFAFEHPTLKELVEVNTDNRA
jgi:23S rRNA pseudouridine1911/1915/1917 synthase